MPPAASTSSKGPGRPARISREKIVDAVLDGQNLDTLTMRELAAALGVSHGALYRWVKNQDEVFDLVGDVMIERILPTGRPGRAGLEAWLAELAWAMHDEFLAVPGFATRLARPHRHSARGFEHLRSSVIAAFASAGLEPELAEQNWYLFVIPTVNWLATQETPVELGEGRPRFDLFLGALLRGLPAREPRERPSDRGNGRSADQATPRAT